MAAVRLTASRADAQNRLIVVPKYLRQVIPKIVRVILYSLKFRACLPDSIGYKWRFVEARIHERQRPKPFASPGQPMLLSPRYGAQNGRRIDAAGEEHPKFHRTE